MIGFAAWLAPWTSAADLTSDPLQVELDNVTSSCPQIGMGRVATICLQQASQKSMTPGHSGNPEWPIFRGAGCVIPALLLAPWT